MPCDSFDEQMSPLHGRLALVGALVALALPAAAFADFPYGVGGPHWHIPAGSGQAPNDFGDDWRLAASAGTDSSVYSNNPMELYGIRGAHVVDNGAAQTAWQVTTGRPDVTLAVLDSGIQWNDPGKMADLRRKVRLNTGELPKPEHADGSTCDSYDCNGDGVVNVDDYAHDPRVNLHDPRRVGPPGVITPQDLLIAFSDGRDDDGNGYVDDIAGWDFLDNDNDPYDDVQYAHGSGEARDSTAEANNGNSLGTCPNCTFIPLRVGNSFIADVNRFGMAVLYAVDNGVLVIQEALGTLNHSALGGAAIDYAYKHGVTVIASAADEAAQHHNWPSTYPHTIVVNSINQYDAQSGVPLEPATPSYTFFNGCTNFSTKVTLAIPSSSCSSNATGNAAGFAGLIYSAAMNAIDDGKLAPHPSCREVNGRRCPLTPDEVKQLLASGSIGRYSQADDVNDASCPVAGNGSVQPQEDVCTLPEPSCSPVPVAGCTDPNALEPVVAANRPELNPEVQSQTYPSRRGFDEFFGYGRANVFRAVDAVAKGEIPPEASIEGPSWYNEIDPTAAGFTLSGYTYARGRAYTCRVEVAPGSQPNNASTINGGDFEQVPSPWCDNNTVHNKPFNGALATIDIQHLKSRFPSGTDFQGAGPRVGPPNFNNRPDPEPFGFTVRLIVTDRSQTQLSGQDRRNFFLHRDRDDLAGFPLRLRDADGASSPLLADLDGDNRNELILGDSNGRIHAFRANGTELPGWPVHTDPLPLHAGQRAFATGAVSPTTSYGAVLTSPAVADLNGDGVPEVVVSDIEGKTYAFRADGTLMWKREANPDWSGKPLEPFVNQRNGPTQRVEHGFVASPVIADLDGDGKPEVIQAGMDRHLYAWHGIDGSDVSGFPLLVVDRSKVKSVDPRSHAVTFKDGVGADLMQGMMVDTPAVADINGDGKPEILVGTNEEYDASNDGGLNDGGFSNPSFNALGPALGPANGRLYAIKSTGGTSIDPSDTSMYVPGWPVKVGILLKELLPIVGEGINGNPVVAPVTCQSGGAGNKVGVLPDAGPGYVFNADGSSCYGKSPSSYSIQNGGKQYDNAVASDFSNSVTNEKYDTPAIPAVGYPAFAKLDGQNMSFLGPVTGTLRATDLLFNDYQRGQDFLSAWDATNGNFRDGFPSPVSDLQFLTGPAVADIDGQPGQEVVGGTASLDFVALNGSGQPASSAWPKLSTDWTVTTPDVGTFGTTDTDSSAHKVVIGVTRSGYVFAFKTSAPACSPSESPRFHHDNANSGWYGRDAVLPGVPMNATFGAGTLSWDAPGDDLLCGTATRYEVATSRAPITPANFGSATPVAGAPAPAAAGTHQTFTPGGTLLRYVAIRAIDDQGNIGRPALVKTTG